MPGLYRALVIDSPHAGRSQEFSEAMAVLQQTGIEVVDIVPIAQLNVFMPQNERWSQRTIDLVIAAGGDGLIAGALPLVLEHQLPPGILSLGTSNNTARVLAIPQDLPGVADSLPAVTHGYGGLQRWTLGSITERVLHATKLPLLIVPPQRDLR